MIKIVIPIAGFKFKSKAFPEAKENNANSYPVPISFFNPAMNHSNNVDVKEDNHVDWLIVSSMADLFTLRP